MATTCSPLKSNTLSKNPENSEVNFRFGTKIGPKRADSRGYKGGLISESILTLVSLPIKVAKMTPLSRKIK